MAGNLQMDIAIQNVLGKHYLRFQMITRNAGLSILADMIIYVMKNTRAVFKMSKSGHQSLQFN